MIKNNNAVINTIYGLKEVPPESVPYFLGVVPVEPPKKHWYKIHHDGGHYIAKPIYEKIPKEGCKKKKGINALRVFFDMLYQQGLQEGFKKFAHKEFIKDNLHKEFPDLCNIDEYIDKEYKRQLSNRHKRDRTYKRKANLHKWNYFVTFTYDDDKHTEESFRKKVRRTLSNLSSRRQWRIMGVFERGGDTERLHFHAVAYIPDGQMIGKLFDKKDYCFKTGRMKETTQNTFFNKYYGRSDFEPVNPHCFGYLLKYIAKSGERIVYSRGISQEFDLQLAEDDIACEMSDKRAGFFVLFDDVIDYERDVLKCKPQQTNMWGLLSNPPPNFCAG